MECPLVSIVVPSFNQVRYVERTLRSLLAQDYPHVEVLVLDAQSTDGSVEVLRQYASQLDVLIIAPDDGQADALDRGFRLAQGQILGYLNSDDVLSGPRVLSEMVEHFRLHPQIDVVSGRRRVIDSNGYYLGAEPYRPFDADRLRQTCYLPQEATFWTRSLYERAGGFVDSSLHFAMDYDLWLRFLDVGGRFLTVDRIWGLFRTYADQKSQAQWRQRGLPEIARLHQRHLGLVRSEEDLIQDYQQHYWLAHPKREPLAFAINEGYWRRTVAFEAKLLHSVHLDRWTGPFFQDVQIDQDELRLSA